MLKQSEGGYYIWNVKWLNAASIITVFVNRKQNKAVTAINDAYTGYVLTYKDYPSYESDYNGWLLPSGLLCSSIYNYFFQIWPYEGFKTIISFDTNVYSQITSIFAKVRLFI